VRRRRRECEPGGCRDAVAKGRSAISRDGKKKRRKGRGRTLSLARGSSFSGTRCSSGVCKRIISAVWLIRKAKGRKRRREEEKREKEENENDGSQLFLRARRVEGRAGRRVRTFLALAKSLLYASVHLPLPSACCRSNHLPATAACASPSALRGISRCPWMMPALL
jgi:hypothetical protein